MFRGHLGAQEGALRWISWGHKLSWSKGHAPGELQLADLRIETAVPAVRQTQTRALARSHQRSNQGVIIDRWIAQKTYPLTRCSTHASIAVCGAQCPSIGATPRGLPIKNYETIATQCSRIGFSYSQQMTSRSACIQSQIHARRAPCAAPVLPYSGRCGEGKGSLKSLLVTHYPSHIPTAIDDAIQQKFPVRLAGEAMRAAAQQQVL